MLDDSEVVYLEMGDLGHGSTCAVIFYKLFASKLSLFMIFKRKMRLFTVSDDQACKITNTYISAYVEKWTGMWKFGYLGNHNLV